MVTGIISAVVGLLTILIKWYLGRRGSKEEMYEKDREILKRQRDNNVNNIDDARKLLNKLRDDK